MNETLTKFRNAVSDSTDLQEKVKAGADLVALGKENGYEFTTEELNTGWKQLQESDKGLTEFELRERLRVHDRRTEHWLEGTARIRRRPDRVRDGYGGWW